MGIENRSSKCYRYRFYAVIKRLEKRRTHVVANRLIFQPFALCQLHFFVFSQMEVLVVFLASWVMLTADANPTPAHYGKCNGRAKLPALKDRPTPSPLLDPEDGVPVSDPVRYTYAQGRVACPFGEKVVGQVQLWEDDGVRRGDRKAKPGMCGPE